MNRRISATSFGISARVRHIRAEVQHLATTLIQVAAVVPIFDGLNIVSYGALKGAGDTRGPLVIVVVMNWLVGVPLVYLLTISANLGALGAWLGMATMLAGQGGVLVLPVPRREVAEPARGGGRDTLGSANGQLNRGPSGSAHK